MSQLVSRLNKKSLCVTEAVDTCHWWRPKRKKYTFSSATITAGRFSQASYISLSFPFNTVCVYTFVRDAISRQILQLSRLSAMYLLYVWYTDCYFGLIPFLPCITWIFFLFIHLKLQSIIWGRFAPIPSTSSHWEAKIRISQRIVIFHGHDIASVMRYELPTVCFGARRPYWTRQPLNPLHVNNSL